MSDGKRLDECLSTQDGQLFIEAYNTLDLLRKFGTPMFVLSENQIRRNVRRFQKSFQEGWPDGPLKVMPAAKANWISAVQRILAEEGCGCDTYSPGELTIALEAGFDPEFISVNGVPKDDGANTRQKFLLAKGFGEVIIGAKLEQFDLSFLEFDRADHDNWRIGVGAHDLADLHPIDFRHHQI